MDTFTLFPNFITPTEAAEIVAWAVTKKGDCIDRQNLHGGGLGSRFSQSIGTLRHTQGTPRIDTPVPDIIDELLERVEVTLGVSDNKRLKYKLVIHETGSDTQDHVDAFSAQYPNFIRAAILVQEATQGGIFRVNNIPQNFPELSMLSFVGNSTHEVTNVAQGERILLRANWRA